MYTSTYAPKPSITFPAEQVEADAELMKRCEGQRKESAQHWQCDSEVQSMEDKRVVTDFTQKFLQACEEQRVGKL